MFEAIVVVPYVTAYAMNFLTEVDIYNLKIRIDPSKMICGYQTTKDPHEKFFYDMEHEIFKSYINTTIKRDRFSTYFTVNIGTPDQFMSDVDSAFFSERYIDSYLYAAPVSTFESRRIIKLYTLLRRCKEPTITRKFYLNLFYIYSTDADPVDKKKILRFKFLKNYIVDETFKQTSITINSKVDGLTPGLVSITNEVVI